jgi:hypothetical protein
MKPALSGNVQKYLDKYGCKRWKLEIELELKFDCVIVVPAIAEHDNLITLLNSLSENEFDKDHGVAVIFVINSIVSSSQEVKTENQKTLELFREILNKNSSYHPVVEKINSTGLTIGFIDASSEGKGMPEKTGGVGLARKIGMDLALTIFDYLNPKKKIIVCLDADCIIEKNYIEEIINSFNTRNISAATINYEHPFPENEEKLKAIICYEIVLRYYELGLKYAGSAYAIQIVGSTMCCDYEMYIKVEGMNKKKAGEDFYFLEKIIKNYEIEKISSTKVFPAGRPSWRVPFGTGQRINRFLSKSQNEYLLYDPKSFVILKKWLELFNNKNTFSTKNYLQKAKEIHPELFAFLKQQNFESNWEKISINSKDEKHLHSQKIKWFDGFRTLKLIHHLRDTAFPQINMFDALDILFKQFNLSPINDRTEEIPKISVQLKYLKTLRNVLNNDN